MKKFFSVFLLILISANILFLSCKESSKQNYKTGNNEIKLPDNSSSADTLTGEKKVIAYYFYTTYRCSNCLKIERYSKEAINKYFAKEIEDKKLEFKPVNVDERQNEHYIRDYMLYTKSLVIASYKGDKQVKWKNLTEVWTHLDNQENFHQYVKAEVEKFLQ